MTVTLSKTSSSRGWQVRTLELQIDPSRAAAAGGIGALCSKLWGNGSSPPYWPNQICSVRTKWTAIHHASLLCTCYYLIRAYTKIYIHAAKNSDWRLGDKWSARPELLSSLWQQSIEERRVGLKKDRSFDTIITRSQSQTSLVNKG